MILNHIKCCVTTLTGDLKFNNNKFHIREIKVDGEEIPSTDEYISCMKCTSNDTINKTE